MERCDYPKASLLSYWLYTAFYELLRQRYKSNAFSAHLIGQGIMSNMPQNRSDEWNIWTQFKLRLLAAYLDEFTTASKNKAYHTLYLDLFAGIADNKDKAGAPFFGSPEIALQTYAPGFRQLLFLKMTQKRLEQQN